MPELALSGISVLVVDDDEDTCVLYRLALGDLGATVHTATTAVEALAVVNEAVPDVIVSDIAMPDQDGYELIRAVRARAREAGAEPLAVAVSGWTHREAREEALVAGFDEYRPKPCTPAAIAVIIAERMAAARSLRTPVEQKAGEQSALRQWLEVRRVQLGSDAEERRSKRKKRIEREQAGRSDHDVLE